MIYTGKMNAALFLVFLTRLIAGAAKKVFLIVDHLSTTPQRKGSEIMPLRVAASLRELHSTGTWP
jgi:hypothetical protein